MRIAMFLVFALAAVAVNAATQIEGLRIWPAPDHTRLVLDTAGSVEHNVFSLSSPARLVIDLKNTSLKTDFGNVDVTGSPSRRSRAAPRNGCDPCVVLDLKSASSPRSFVREPDRQYGHRGVVERIDEAGSRLERATSPPVTKD